MTQMLDVKGLNCPLPVLRTKKAMKSIPKGETLVVEATDPNVLRDIPALCEAAGYQLIGTEEKSGVYVFSILQPA
jgi:tRNA 2-thiouridine synthesizing protein A